MSRYRETLHLESSEWVVGEKLGAIGDWRCVMGDERLLMVTVDGWEVTGACTMGGR